MTATFAATIAGTATAIFWGAGDWATPRDKHKLHTFQINFAVQLVGVVLFMAILCISSYTLPPLLLLLAAAGIGALIAGGYLLFVKALTEGAVGIIVPLSNIYPMGALVLSVLFLDTAYTHRQILAMIVIAIGSILLAYEQNRQKIPLRKLHKATLYVLFANCVWAVAFTLLNLIINRLSWQQLLFIEGITSLAIAIICVAIRFRRQTLGAIKHTVISPWAMTAGLLLGIGAVTLYMGGSKIHNIIIPAVLSTTSLLISATLAALIDHERLGIMKRMGTVAAIGGLVILNFH